MSKREIQPAGPLREMPEDGEYIICDYEGDVMPIYWSSITAYMIEAGRIYPGTEAGRLGAERRAKMGILPPIDREGHGVFVPEREIERLSDAIRDADALYDFFESHKYLVQKVEEFLQAIKQGGQDE